MDSVAASALAKRRRTLVAAFVVVGALSAGVTLFETIRTSTIESHAKDLGENMLASIGLVTRIEHDVDQVHHLVERHILESEVGPWSAAEAQIAALRTDAENASKAYDSLSNLSGERGLWERARIDMVTIDVAVEEAVALSRASRDADARSVLRGLDHQFATLGESLRSLVHLNERAATESLAHIQVLRHHLMLLIVGSGLLTLAGILVVGAWTVVVARDHEDQAARYLALLEDRNRDLDAFAARVAHDVRGPLAAMNLTTTLLGQRAPQEEQLTARLRRGIAQMDALVTDLLALATAEKQEAGVSDPAAVATAIGEEYSPRVESEHGALVVKCAHACAGCAEGLLHQVLVNLTENAIKYRRREVPVRIDITGVVADGQYVLRIADNGLGMMPDDAEHVFDPLYRSKRVKEVPGTGLGLSIVKRIIDGSGGSVSVESTTVGAGTVFAVRLPLAGTSPHAPSSRSSPRSA